MIGSSRLPAEMAVRFGKLFGNGSGFWFNLQHNNDLARAERSVDISRIPTLETMHSWTTAVRNCTSLEDAKIAMTSRCSR